MPLSTSFDKKIVPLLQELIRNKCVNDGSPDSGQEIRSVETLTRFFNQYGIKGEILSSAPGRANLVIRIPGREADVPSLAYLNHLDVVPANGENWSADPFGADVRGGYVWGRGTVDMLGTTATQAVAFAELVSEKGALAGDFLFIATADEEASGRLGARWLIEQHWDKVRTDYVVTELGGFFIRGERDESGIMVTVGEKGVAWMRLKTSGVAGHGSTPMKAQSAAYKIGRALEKLAAYAPRLDFSGEYREMVDALHISRRQKAMLKDKKQCDKALSRMYTQEEGMAKFLHAASRLTISPNVVHVGNKINIIPDQGIAELDIRILPGQTVEYVIHQIEKALGALAAEFEIEIIEYYPSTSSSIQTPLYEATKEIIGGVFPLARPIPFFIPSVTDGRFFRKKGCVVYGFGLVHEDLTLTEYARIIHGKDERISVKSLELSYHYFHKLPEIFYNKVRLEQ